MSDLQGRARLVFPLATAGITGCISLLTVYELIHDTADAKPWLGFIAVWYVFALVTLAFLVAMVRTFQTIKKEKYANITYQIHEILHNTRNLYTYMEQQAETAKHGDERFGVFQERVREKFIAILDGIAHLFSMITGTTCRACIKTVFVRDGVSYMQTFARDRRSYDHCFRRDETRRETLHDRLEYNSEFLRMMKLEDGTRGEWHFFCNDVEMNETFKSTSISAYDPEYALKGPQRRVLGKASWKVPYRSTVCSAIGQAAARDIKPPTGGDAIVLGFLAVDSESRGVFSERWDVQLVYAFADALFHPLRRYLKVFSKVSGSSA